MCQLKAFRRAQCKVVSPRLGAPFLLHTLADMTHSSPVAAKPRGHKVQGIRWLFSSFKFKWNQIKLDFWLVVAIFTVTCWCRTTFQKTRQHKKKTQHLTNCNSKSENTSQNSAFQKSQHFTKCIQQEANSVGATLSLIWNLVFSEIS